jgi:SAM-dependent methyltransferase
MDGMSATTERAMMNDAEFANIASAEEHFWWYRGMREVLDAALDRAVEGRRVARVLEAGCGTGYNARLFETARGWTMFPVDLGWEGLQYGNSMGVERLAQADIGALPFPAEVFDAVVSLDVIVHFPKGQERLIRQIQRYFVMEFAQKKEQDSCSFATIRIMWMP